MSKRFVVVCYIFLVIICSKCAGASVKCFLSTKSPDVYSESNEEGVSGCSLESPIKYGHGAANFVKRLKLGVLREKAGEASCKFRRGRSEIEMGKLKDEAFTNRSGIRILCSCYSHGCNGMYESFEVSFSAVLR